MTPALQILLVGLGTYAIRVSAIAMSSRFAKPSPSTEVTLRMIGPAVLAAIVADRLLLDHGELVVRWDWWLGAIIAALVAWRWRSAGITMAVGMVAVWSLGPLL